MNAKRVKHKHIPLSRDKQKLVEDNLWVAGRQAHRHYTLCGGNTGVFTKEDLESVGRYALCVAASRWEEDRGVKFSTYAWVTVSGYIQHSLRDHSRMVKVPRWVLYIRHEIKALLDSGLSEEEVMDELSLTENQMLMVSFSWKESYKSLDYIHEDDFRCTEIPHHDISITEALFSVDSDYMKVLSELSDSEIRSFGCYLEGGEVSKERKRKFDRIIQDFSGKIKGLQQHTR